MSRTSTGQMLRLGVPQVSRVLDVRQARRVLAETGVRVLARVVAVADVVRVRAVVPEIQVVAGIRAVAIARRTALLKSAANLQGVTLRRGLLFLLAMPVILGRG